MPPQCLRCSCVPFHKFTMSLLWQFSHQRWPQYRKKKRKKKKTAPIPIQRKPGSSLRSRMSIFTDRLGFFLLLARPPAPNQAGEKRKSKKSRALAWTSCPKKGCEVRIWGIGTCSEWTDGEEGWRQTLPDSCTLNKLEQLPFAWVVHRELLKFPARIVMAPQCLFP